MAFNEQTDEQRQANAKRVGEWLTPEAQTRLETADPARLRIALVLAQLGDARALTDIMLGRQPNL